MSDTLLELVQDTCGEMGLAVPSSVVGNQAADVVQLRALITAVGRELVREFEWEKLCKEYLFETEYVTTTGTWTTSADTVTAIPSTTGLDTTYGAIGAGLNNTTMIESVDSATQVTLTQTPTAAGTAAAISFAKLQYAVPSDFDRTINRTQWDRSQHWEMLGPESPQQWQWLKSGYISTGPRIRYRMLAGYFQIWPAIAATHYEVFEYVSQFWIYATGGAQPTKKRFTADTDTTVFPDRLMVSGLKNAYYQAKGLGDTYLQEYMDQLNIAKATDKGAPTLAFAPRPANVLLQFENIPDGTIYGQ